MVFFCKQNITRHHNLLIFFGFVVKYVCLYYVVVFWIWNKKKKKFFQQFSGLLIWKPNVNWNQFLNYFGKSLFENTHPKLHFLLISVASYMYHSNKNWKNTVSSSNKCLLFCVSIDIFFTSLISIPKHETPDLCK